MLQGVDANDDDNGACCKREWPCGWNGVTATAHVEDSVI
jgi:hypothetical protein